MPSRWERYRTVSCQQGLPVPPVKERRPDGWEAFSSLPTTTQSPGIKDPWTAARLQACVLLREREAEPPALPYREWELNTFLRVTCACNASSLLRPTSDPACCRSRSCPPPCTSGCPQRHTGSLDERGKVGREGKAQGHALKPGVLCSSPVLPFPRSSDAQLTPSLTQQRCHSWHTTAPRPQTTKASPPQGPESTAMRKKSSVLLKDSTGRHQPYQQNTLPLQNQGTAGRGGLWSSLCLEKDQGQVDTHQISGAPTLQVTLQRPKGQSNQIQFRSQKGRRPAVWRAAVHQAWKALLTLQGAGVGLHPRSQLSPRTDPCLTADPPPPRGRARKHTS